ncbi:G2/mitotic-specific cyclin-A [Onthophagus taurus]|uniref:G2/mitotic-specific cyclin-A n=1 Tax=Onthophagus taurus TaxID=166361 RepID=UPI000C2005B2|nr:G2/mitotic-specific cyclin-A [Onthophagus taurus]
MASFNIHEDQENCPAFRQNKTVLAHGGVQKRTVLGAIDNRSERFFNKKQSQNGNRDDILPKKSVPVVPVAQFEAFNVYEDIIDEKRTERQRKRKEKDIYCNVYKGTEEDRFVTKKEVKEMAARLQQQALLNPEEEVRVSVSDRELERIIASPMNIEKGANKKLDKTINRTAKDYFFECIEYRGSILEYLCEREKLNRPKPGYMVKQPDITHNMRAILVDWLVEVAEEYKLHTETLYLSVSYIDRFLSYMSVVRAKLQLVGTAAMFIAAKYEEIYPPDVGEFVYITDDTYNKRQVTRMEMLILRILDFELSIPTPYTFITAIGIANELPDNMLNLAMYISELSLLEAEPTLKLLPSMIAASSIAIARHTLEMETWTKGLEQCTGYSLKDMDKTIDFLYKLYRGAGSMQQQAIQSKYKSAKFLHVAEISPRNESIDIV